MASGCSTRWRCGTTRPSANERGCTSARALSRFQVIAGHTGEKAEHASAWTHRFVDGNASSDMPDFLTLDHDRVPRAPTRRPRRKASLMNKKILLLTLTILGATVLALPGTASALEPLHLSPMPGGPRQFDDMGVAVVSGSTGHTFACQEFEGNVEFNAGGTTGSISLNFNCINSLFGTKCSLTTTTLPFHLVTLAGGSPGILVTTSNGHFGSFTCLFMGELKGTGLIGTITSPGCGGTSSQGTIKFERVAHGVQKHTKVLGTETVYTVKRGTETIALEATGTLTLSSNTTLVCT